MNGYDIVSQVVTEAGKTKFLKRLITDPKVIARAKKIQKITDRKNLLKAIGYTGGSLAVGTGVASAAHVADKKATKRNQ